MIVIIRPIVDKASAWNPPLDFGPADREYVEGMIHEGRAAEARTARYALMDALNQRFERHDLVWLLERAEHGAPLLRLGASPSYLAPASSDAGRAPVAPAISLAHSELAAVAATCPARCGVDIEPITRTRINNAWKRVASTEERDWILALPPNQRTRYTILSWTLKESWSKLTGDGLARRGRELIVEPLKAGGVQVHCPLPISAFTANFGGHIVSLLVEGDNPLSRVGGTEAPWVKLPCQLI